ncbi:cobalamin-dependent protein, partial [Streptomyces sulphureus]|uniref:cobalamin-dependent protein n=1 Tax=Streptomyces sulphureus TaxID=47758 RepID=UPI000475C660
MKSAGSAGRVMLVSMPWNNVRRPSIQVGTLRAVAEEEGWQVTPEYAYLAFYGLAKRMLGYGDAEWSDAYDLISEGLYHFSVGDWIFACRGTEAARRDEYVEELRSRKIDEPTIGLIDSLREVAERHVEETAAALLASDPDVIGFTSTFSQNGPTLAVAERLRASGYPGVIVMGGSNCEGSMGRALLENYPAVEAVVDGPGEDAFVALLRQVAAGGPVRSQGRLLTRRPAGGADAAESGTGISLTGLSVPTPNYDGYFEQLHAAGLEGL